jgi:hypothetical protein
MLLGSQALLYDSGYINHYERNKGGVTERKDKRNGKVITEK